jgi:hypothetical protein
MKISELRKRLKKAQAAHGDIEVYMNDGGCGCCSNGDDVSELEVTRGYLRWKGTPREVLQEWPDGPHLELRS